MTGTNVVPICDILQDDNYKGTQRPTTTVKSTGLARKIIVLVVVHIFACANSITYRGILRVCFGLYWSLIGLARGASTNYPSAPRPHSAFDSPVDNFRILLRRERRAPDL
jgi:hypothetical protein